jgi:hypothetical protein
MSKKPQIKAQQQNVDKKKYLSQKDVPSMTINDALRVARAIVENYGGNPTTPLKVAKALEMEPRKTRFVMMTGASIAYGLTIGGYNAEKIALTELGRKIVKPLIEGEESTAMKEAFLRPRII